MQDAQIKWERVRARLCAEVGESVFDRFLKPVSLLEAERGRVRLGAGSRFLRDFIASNFSERIYRAWQSERPEIIAVDIITSQSAPSLPAQAVPAPASSSAGGFVPPANPRGPGISSLSSPRNPTGLVPIYTFDNFVAGPSNALALEAARRVVESPGTRYNPLFIYGPTGVGKTHLEHAIGNAILAARPEARVRYLSAERFLYLFVTALREKNPFAFKEEYRSTDVLLIDDFQYIAGQATQNEFLHTLNTLIAANHQVVISADAAPGSLRGVDEAMRARLGRGMTVDIAETDGALRLGSLTTLRERFEASQRAQKRRPIEFAPDVLPFLAERLATNGHELSGAFNRISGQAEFEGVPVTIDFVQRTLKDVIQGSDRPPTIEEILQAVSAYTGIKVVDMKGARRTQDIVRARHMAWWLCRDMTERSYPQIAQKFGGRDHTTCIAGKRRIDKQRETDAKLVGDLEAIIKILRKQ
jgi:chromosomal replication initiator protein